MTEADNTPVIMWVRTTYGGKTATKSIDHAVHSDRQWLAKHAWWAMRAGAYLETWPDTLAGRDGPRA